MYFIYPSRVLRQLDRALALFADFEWVKLSQVEQCDPNRIYIADVHDYLSQHWTFPTVVVARENEGYELSQAWQRGALAGWIWDDLPKHPFDELTLIDAQYKRNQDSRDLPTAAELQKKLLPRPIQIQDYQFNSLFQPSAYLSGDWYDYWQVDDEHILFYLADVSGHGVASSLLTSWMAAFHGRAKTPQQFIIKLNDMLIKENIEKHITMVAGLLDLKNHTLTCCNSGHFPPAVHFVKGQNPNILTSSSFPLGLTDDLQLDERTLHMSPGSRLVLCSDGALESFQGGINEQFHQLVDELAIDAYTPNSQVNDDIAILSICRNAE